MNDLKFTTAGDYMNDRIQTLEKQCWSHRVADVLVDGQLHFDTRKFAELIVRECIEQVITGPNGPAHYAVEAALRLKKHFGVEE